MAKIEELTEKELRKLRRKDLLILLLEQAKQTEQLEKTMEDMQQQYEQREREREQLLSVQLAQQEERFKALFDRMDSHLNHTLQNNKAQPAPRTEAFQYARALLNMIQDGLRKQFSKWSSYTQIGTKKESKKTNA